MPRDHSCPIDYYNTKKLIKDLGLPMEKIDACKNGCMLYWKDDIDLDYSKFCGKARDCPVRLVLSTAEQNDMHANHQDGGDPHVHPSDMRRRGVSILTDHTPFCSEPTEVIVRLGLCTHGFTPHGSNVARILVSPL
ncbi:UNVERIFIED_CONTAM: hypothetical protein Slati_0403100 [Sesamum latifolium]|uniref:Uncharacterized protein n=1 Tax=Sesamum latifolium TaxID=2727402 RepID=A0AAW2XUF1_9LAMI